MFSTYANKTHAQIFLEKYPARELWRFVINGVLQKRETGWLGFVTRESLYTKGIYLGAKIAFSDLQEPITSDYLKRLRGAASADVVSSLREADKFRGNHALDAKMFTDLPHTSIRGLKELLDKIEKGAPNAIQSTDILTKNFISIDASNFAEERKRWGCNDNIEFAIKLHEFGKKHEDDDQGLSVATDNSKKKIEDAVEEAIGNYNEKIISATSLDEKLRTIVDFVQTLEQIHPFKDANCRTFIMLLMNRLLIQNGFYPAIFDDPNYFDGYSIDELVQETKKGMRRTEEIIQGNMQLYDISTDDVLSRLSEVQVDFFNNTMTEKLKTMMQICQQSYIKYGVAKETKPYVVGDQDKYLHTDVHIEKVIRKKRKTKPKIWLNNINPKFEYLRDLQRKFQAIYDQPEGREPIGKYNPMRIFKRSDFNYSNKQIMDIKILKKHFYQTIEKLTVEELNSPEFQAIIRKADEASVPNVIDFQTTTYDPALREETTTRKNIESLISKKTIQLT